jgi:hypothetical protein
VARLAQGKCLLPAVALEMGTQLAQGAYVAHRPAHARLLDSRLIEMLADRLDGAAAHLRA